MPSPTTNRDERTPGSLDDQRDRQPSGGMQRRDQSRLSVGRESLQQHGSDHRFVSDALRADIHHSLIPSPLRMLRRPPA